MLRERLLRRGPRTSSRRSLSRRSSSSFRLLFDECCDPVGDGERESLRAMSLGSSEVLSEDYFLETMQDCPMAILYRHVQFRSWCPDHMQSLLDKAAAM